MLTSAGTDSSFGAPRWPVLYHPVPGAWNRTPRACPSADILPLPHPRSHSPGQQKLQGPGRPRATQILCFYTFLGWFQWMPWLWGTCEPVLWSRPSWGGQAAARFGGGRNALYPCSCRWRGRERPASSPCVARPQRSGRRVRQTPPGGPESRPPDPLLALPILSALPCRMTSLTLVPQPP